MDNAKQFDIRPIGYVRSTLKERKGAPRQGWEGAPDARLEINPEFAECLDKHGVVISQHDSRKCHGSS